MSKEICREILMIAEKEFDKIKESLSVDTNNKFILFTETVRVLDFSILSQYGQKSDHIVLNNILKMGWNLSASILFEGYYGNGFPIAESTKKRFDYAIGIMYNLGCTIMLKRAVDMINAGFISVTKENDTFIFTKIKNSDLQFLDFAAKYELDKLHDKLNDKIGKNYDEWFVEKGERMNAYSNKTGSFLISNDYDFNTFSSENIEKLLHEMVFPWHTGYGIMTGYNSNFEIEKHYIGKALELIIKWEFEAGFHPKTKIGNITGDILSIIVVIITSLHLKHIESCLAASKKHSQISLRQSLTIWSIKSELIQNIAGFSGIDKTIVSETLDLILMRPNDVEMLQKYSTEFMPILIDIGNGMILRPISSITENPFFSIIAILEHRNPSFRNNLMLHREEWLRNNLYKMFLGTRYKTVNGNIKLKTGDIVDTDIDAVIFDNVTGELALFQIKWQDFHFNDVKKLISKAKNLSHTLDDWAQKVNNWIELNGQSKLLQTLRIKAKNNVPISNIYLFAISKNIGRTIGFGYPSVTENLAVSSWAQFSRNRIQIGPSKNVFNDLFEALKIQEKENFKSIPLPAEFSLDNITFHFKDVWSTYK